MGIEVAALALRGELARARRRLDELEVAAQAYGSTGVERIFAPLDVVVRFWECRTDELGPRIAALRAGLTAMIPGMDGFTAMIAACGGRQEEADAVLDRYVGPDADDCWQGDFLAPLALGHLCYAAIVGDRQDLAPQLIRWLEPMSGHLVGTTASILMSADGLRADLLRILGRLDEAIGVAQSAIDASRLRDTELLLGYELVVLADALRAAGRSGDSGGAAAEAEQLGRSTGARRIGMELRRRALR